MISTSAPAPAVTADPIAALIERFEFNMANHLHSLSSDYRRSEARIQLLELGSQVIPALAEHLPAVIARVDYEGQPMSAVELRTVWLWFLNELSVYLGVSNDNPLAARDLAAWRPWLEKCVA